MPEPKVRFKMDDGNNYPTWAVDKLGNICEPHARIGWQNLRTDEFLDDGDYYLVTGTDFHNGKVNFKSCHYIDKDRYNQDKNIQIKNGHVLITKDGTLGKVALVSGMDKPGTLNAGVFVLQNVSIQLENVFLYQYLAAPFLLRFAAGKSTGGTIQHLNQGVLVDFEVPIPCLEEQQKIADFLSTVDEVISTSEAEVTNLEKQKKAVMKKIFSQEVRFKREDGSDFPEWEETRLCDVCSKIGSGKTPKGGSEVYTQDGVLFIRSQNVTNAMLDLADRTCIPKSVHEGMRNTELQYLDVLLNITGASIGRCCLFDLHEIANVNQHVCIIRLKDKESYIPKYVEQIMLSDYIQNQIWSCQNGGSREGLNFEQIGNFSFLSPCLEEQRLIADFLSSFDEAIVAAKKELELWKELKKGLLQQMFV